MPSTPEWPAHYSTRYYRHSSRLWENTCQFKLLPFGVKPQHIYGIGQLLDLESGLSHTTSPLPRIMCPETFITYSFSAFSRKCRRQLSCPYAKTMDHHETCGLFRQSSDKFWFQRERLPALHLCTQLHPPSHFLWGAQRLKEQTVEETNHLNFK
jgi:hypothetical protein